jgi:predicted nuclease of predicted toxin-antitoxin system
VRFLLDENISPHVAPLLTAAGHDAIHVQELGLSRASDEAVLAAARERDCVLVSADADFGAILARSNVTGPSVLFLRRQQRRRATEVAALIVANQPVLAADLEAGALVVIDDHRIRVRSLPLDIV